MAILALFSAALVGVSLGLLGGGGSTLAVPILVYAAGMSAKAAIAVSLVVVGTTCLIGAFRHRYAANVDLRTAFVFGVVSMLCSYGGGRIGTKLPDAFHLTLFALMMLAASAAMFRSRSEGRGGPVRVPLVVGSAACVGLLTGLVGIGGGFMIVPALMLFAGLPMRRAVGTSLVVMAMNCAAGFIAYAGRVRIDWRYTALFTSLAVGGVFIGSALAPRVPQLVLKRTFATLMITVAIFMLAR